VLDDDISPISWEKLDYSQFFEWMKLIFSAIDLLQE